jgi:hypothetical protein
MIEHKQAQWVAETAVKMYDNAIEMAQITIEGYVMSESGPAPDTELAKHVLHIATTPDGVGRDRVCDIAKLLSKYRRAETEVLMNAY